MTVGGETVDLTATEYELLRVLSLDPGRVVTFETLLRRVWAKPESAGANLVRNLVRNLRRKLGESASSLPAERARRRLPHGEAAEPVRPAATEPRRPARPEFAALARDRDDGPLAHVESHPATPAAPPGTPRVYWNGELCRARPPHRLDGRGHVLVGQRRIYPASTPRRRAKRPAPRSPRSPGVVNDPGGLPRDRNTPKFEIRWISDLETLGNHEP